MQNVPICRHKSRFWAHAQYAQDVKYQLAKTKVVILLHISLRTILNSPSIIYLEY